MRQRLHLPRGARRFRDREALARRIALLGRRQRGAREAIGERRLADALRSGQQPGVMHAPAGQRLGQHALGVVVAVELLRLARMREALEPVGLRQLLDTRRWRARAPLSRRRQQARLHRLPHGGEHGALVLRRIDDDAALRLGAGDVAKGVAQLPVEGEVALLVGVGLGVGIDLVDAPAVRAPEAELGRDIEDERQVGERRR